MITELAVKPGRPQAARALTFLLTHPAAMRVKRGLRDLAWVIKGRSVRNPPLPRRPRSILFVCLGNICRSPFAAARTRRLLADAGFSDVTCGSAGIRVGQAARPPREACEAAARVGVTLESHEPLQLTCKLVRSFDIVVVMEHAQMVALRTDYPEAADRIILLSLFGGNHRSVAARYDISDPFGHPLPVFDDCYARIDGAVRGLLKAAGWDMLA